MKLKPMILSVILLASSVLLAVEPSKAQEAANVVNLPLTFHGYSLLTRDANNSFYVYDGADGAAPDLVNAMQVNVDAQISGQRSGWNYWSAIVVWAVQLQSEVHVSGTVNVRAYISSKYKFSGFISGGGYGMGLVDIDENNVEVKEFITESQAVYGNPFTETPTQYSLNTNVDYVFKKGHAIGFAVGLGATEQGFTATVYFGSPDRNSGATLPVEDTTNSYSFTADYNGTSYNIAITSNSIISNCQFDSATRCIQFKAQGINYTTGYCNVWVPKTLMQAPFTITQGTQPITPTLNENVTHTQLYFPSTRNANPIQITAATTPPTTATPTASPPIPEYPLLTVFPILIAAALLALIIRRKKHHKNLERNFTKVCPTLFPIASSIQKAKISEHPHTTLIT
jgi:hypothetical protein